MSTRDILGQFGFDSLELEDIEKAAEAVQDFAFGAIITRAERINGRDD